MGISVEVLNQHVSDSTINPRGLRPQRPPVLTLNWEVYMLEPLRAINVYVFHATQQRREWHPTPVFSPGKSHQQRLQRTWTRLSDYTTRYTQTHTHTCRSAIIILLAMSSPSLPFFSKSHFQTQGCEPQNETASVHRADTPLLTKTRNVQLGFSFLTSAGLILYHQRVCFNFARG